MAYDPNSLANAHSAYANAVKTGDEWYAKQTTDAGRAAAAQGKTDALAKAKANVASQQEAYNVNQRALQSNPTGQVQYDPNSLARGAVNKVATVKQPYDPSQPGSYFNQAPGMMYSDPRESGGAGGFPKQNSNDPWAAIPQTPVGPGNGSLELPFELDLADQRAQAGAGLANTNTQLDQLMSSLQLGQQSQARDLGRWKENDAREDLSRFAGRGMAYSSGYGQEVADSGQSYLNRMNDLNTSTANQTNSITNQRLNAQNAFNDVLTNTGRTQAERAAAKAGTLLLGQKNDEITRQTGVGQTALNSAKMVNGQLYDTRTGRLAYIGPNGESGSATQQAGMVGTVMQDGRIAYYYPIGSDETKNSTPVNRNPTQSQDALNKAHAAYAEAVKVGDEWYAKQTTQGGRDAAAKSKQAAMARAAEAVANEKAKLGMK